MKHKCETYSEWLISKHHYCSCGHVEWAHHGLDRFNKTSCAHCNCKQYNGEVRPLTSYEIMKANKE